MGAVLNMAGSFGFPNTLWVFLLLFVLHELEEWNIAKVERRNYVDAPPAMTDRNARAWIAVACLIGLVWCAAAAVPGNPVVAAYVFMPAIFIVLTNAIQHVYWSLYFRRYSPGTVTAVLLMIPISVLMVMTALRMGYVPAAYVAILAAGLVLGFIDTVRTGRKTPSVVRGVYGIGSWASGIFKKRQRIP